jgi:transcription elongation factor GreA
MAEHISLTRAGYEKLKKELDYLKTAKRKEISQQIAHARSFGDLSENAEYDAAKEAQARLERRIAELENTLSRATILDDAQIDKNKAYLGATITLFDLDTKEETKYTLVNAEEADFKQGKISVISPVGKALLGHALKEKIEIQVPAGKLRYQIVRIERN